MVLNFLKINFTTFEEIQKNFSENPSFRLQKLKFSREHLLSEPGWKLVDSFVQRTFPRYYRIVARMSLIKSRKWVLLNQDRVLRSRSEKRSRAMKSPFGRDADTISYHTAQSKQLIIIKTKRKPVTLYGVSYQRQHNDWNVPGFYGNEWFMLVRILSILIAQLLLCPYSALPAKFAGKSKLSVQLWRS